MTEYLDFTKRRKYDERGNRLEVCPKCGRMAAISRFKDGGMHSIHVKELDKVLGIAWMVRDSCLIPKPKEANNG